MAETTDVVILGAGPYGLAAAAHLRRAGVEVRVHGDPMSFWAAMPAGMLLRSNWSASCIAEHEGPLSLDSYCAQTNDRFERPIPLDRFVAYGTWVQEQVAPDVDRRMVEGVVPEDDGFTVTLEDGSDVRARRVVVAAGIAPFVHMPAVAADLPRALVSHISDHQDLSLLAGADVLVVGGGQSALESAALLSEGGARVEVAVRQDHVNWLHGGRYHRMLGKHAGLVYAPTDVGPLGLSRLVAVPELFTQLPRKIQEPLARRAIRPAGATWLVPRLGDVTISCNREIVAATPSQGRLEVTFADGETRRVDHVLFATGYRVDIARYPFLDADLLARIVRVQGYPVLGRGLESSVAGLHFLGAPAAWSAGPIMRFVSGGWYAGDALTRVVTGSTGRPRRAAQARRPDELAAAADAEVA